MGFQMGLEFDWGGDRYGVGDKDGVGAGVEDGVELGLGLDL